MMMSERVGTERWRPSAATLIAGSLVIAGFLLTSVNWWFLVLAALGTFGPGILRELGWLCDKDEFQQRAAHRAGYHAFVVTGVVAFIIVAFLRSSERAIDHVEELASFLLALLWFTWFLSSLLAYWGAKKTSVRILIAFGLVWLTFTILSNIGSEWTGWAALLLHPLLVLPFFALAWATPRWPRIAGLLLLGSAVVLFVFLFFPQIFGPNDANVFGSALVFLLFLGPLFASGIALLAAGIQEDDGDVEDEVSDTDSNITAHGSAVA